MQDSVNDVPDVQDPIRLQENDLRLIQALQISPRAGWSELGRALGAAPTTAARRWERLESSGAAWVSCQPLHGRDSAIAVLEVVCRAGDILQAARTLAEDAAAMTIDVTAGGRDLLITVTCPDQLALGRYLLERVAQIPEVESVRSHVVTRVYLDASRWRLRSLTSREESRISSALPPPPVRPPLRPWTLWSASSWRSSPWTADAPSSAWPRTSTSPRAPCDAACAA
ncbi:hypothetical protein GCM10010467_08500 [Actinocorallia glomerata]|uniref:Lrp/AsnC family transcriptional regulator n=2 Tax=Actinomycetes TaxID=1760 RepID=A0ABP6LU65_9MICC